jgi:hypothetical protein
MPTSVIKAEFDQVHEERRALRNRIEELRATDTRLELEEQLLAQMLRLRQWETDGVVGAAETLQAINAAAPVRKRENLSANVLSIVRQAERPLLPSDVRQRLADRGVQADSSAIRVALRRWAERGQLVRRGRAYETDDSGGSTSRAPSSARTEE